ncbi:AAA family ATPase [Cohnella lupini]|uniref:Putative ATPase n=1 Tax=Cohnella lupini TaxID=1294267 RepID=A0A3D9IJ14_9BACL|nr:AAA family ATPase [Cohnella lupini]RED61732.1 putative ATPase [Cohnella lupini]
MYLHETFLRAIELDRSRVPDFDRYPFNLAAVRELGKLELHPKVTYIIGENGMGKSTLMESIAVAWGFNPEGGTKNFTFSTEATHSNLHEFIRLIRGVRKARDGFFFRAESYYNLATSIEEMDRDPLGGSSIISSYGGKSLHEQSHGESFFATFIHRFGGQGLYILDEPEAALSPLRQMSMLARIHQLVGRDSQFIIATHSPILMAYPDSIMYEMTPEGIQTTTLEETDHYAIMKRFLNDKERMLKELFED